MAAILEPPVTRWVCHLCGGRDATREARVHTRFHACPALGGLTAPMVDEKLDCTVTVEERQDYVGDEIVQTDGNGRPVMAVRTTRTDGEDVCVYAPTATGTARASGIA